MRYKKPLMCCNLKQSQMKIYNKLKMNQTHLIRHKQQANK